jgi:hypothetical protein
MRYFLLIAAAVIAFGATMTVGPTDANAVVCARGGGGSTAPAAPAIEARSSCASRLSQAAAGCGWAA